MIKYLMSILTSQPDPQPRCALRGEKGMQIGPTDACAAKPGDRLKMICTKSPLPCRDFSFRYCSAGHEGFSDHLRLSDSSVLDRYS